MCRWNEGDKGWREGSETERTEDGMELSEVGDGPPATIKNTNISEQNS